MGKLFKGGRYLRENTDEGNTVFNFLKTGSIGFRKITWTELEYMI